MSPEESDFNWVKARVDCSLAVEFGRLNFSAKSNVECRNETLPRNNAVEFSHHNDSDQQFEVSRTPVGGLVGRKYEVIFLRRNNHLLIRDNFLNLSYELTLTLNDDGECRFRIDGKGEFKRWQVMRRALEPIFFDPPPSKAPPDGPGL